MCVRAGKQAPRCDIAAPLRRERAEQKGLITHDFEVWTPCAHSITTADYGAQPFVDGCASGGLALRPMQRVGEHELFFHLAILSPSHAHTREGLRNSWHASAGRECPRVGAESL